MQHNQRPSSKARPLSMDFSKFNPKNSMIYSLLPTAVQRRLPRLNSIRKTVCTSYGWDFEIEGDDRRVDYSTKTPPATPPAYGAEMVVRGTQSESETTEYASYFESPSGFEDNKTPQARSNQQLSETESGIDWKFANQGLHLLSLSVDESATVSQNPAYGNASFARQLYLHGLTYLLRGLPLDLTSDEQNSIRGSLPRTLLILPDLEARNQLSMITRAKLHSANPSPPSILHKFLASTIVQIFILFQFLLPYLKYLLRSAYEYERTHHISEKVLASSIDAADTLGKQSLAVTAALYSMGNGKVGEVLTEAASWFIEGVTGGIHDGVGEGLNIMGVKKPTSVE